MAEKMTLLPCPFCGGEPSVKLPESSDGFATHVYCRCGVQMYGAKSHFASEHEAASKWNARSHLAQPAQAVDVGAIREVIHYLQDEGNACMVTGDGLDAQWGSRILSMGRKLTRAISGEKSGPVDGWKLVPIEPTSAMLAAAQGENVAKGQRQLPRYGTLRRKWAAMLAASPAPDKEG